MIATKARKKNEKQKTNSDFYGLSDNIYKTQDAKKLFYFMFVFAKHCCLVF